MIMRVTAVTEEETLDDIADTPGVIIPTIRSPELYAIIAKPVGVSIQVLLPFFRQGVSTDGYSVSNITFLKLFPEDCVSKPRERRFKLGWICRARIKARNSVKDEHFLD